MQAKRRSVVKALGGAWVAGALPLTVLAQSQAPIKIGFGIALTGGIAASGKAAVIAIEMWAEEVNARGGLLGRPVQLVYYDDQSTPSTVPGIYTKLLEVDRVDLLLSGYGTNLMAPAMPIVMQRNMMFFGMFGLAVNDKFGYDKFFQIQPNGPVARTAFSRGYLDVAMTMNPKPATLAIVGADAEYPQVALDGAREVAKELKLKIVYDRTYPPNTVDYAPVVRAIQATNPDVIFVASYPPDTAGIVRAASEIGLKARMFGGGMIGLQFAALKTQLGPLLNGIVYYDIYVPEPTMKFPGIEEFLVKYRARAAKAGVDLLGLYLPPFAYAQMQIIEQAVKAVGAIDQTKLAAYIHANEFPTIVGPIRFAKNGEWSEARMLFVQFQNVQGNDVEQFKQPGKQVILFPDKYKSGDFKYPYRT